MKGRRKYTVSVVCNTMCVWEPDQTDVDVVLDLEITHTVLILFHRSNWNLDNRINVRMNGGHSVVKHACKSISAPFVICEFSYFELLLLILILLLNIT